MGKQTNRDDDDKLLAAMYLRDCGVPWAGIAKLLGYSRPEAVRGMASKVRTEDEAAHS
jgi:hypothetical protein